MAKTFDMTVGSVAGLSTIGKSSSDVMASAVTPLASLAPPAEFIETPLKPFGQSGDAGILGKSSKTIFEPEVEAADQAALRISPKPPSPPGVSPDGAGPSDQKPMPSSMPDMPSSDPDTNGGWKKAGFILAIILLLAIGFLVKRGYDRDIANNAEALRIAKEEAQQRLNAEISQLQATGKLKRLTVSGPSDVQNMLIHGVLTVENAANLRNGLTVVGDISSTGNVTASGNLTVSGIISAANLSGNGADVVNVDALTLQGQPKSFYTNATNISSGTLGDSRLSTNVALLNSTQTFTGLNTFSQGLSLQGNLAGTTGAFSGNVSGANAINVNEFVTLGQLTTVSAGNYFIQNGNSYGALATLGTNDAFGLALETAGSERVRIDTSGNVGIGTTSPAQKLDITGGNLRLDSTSFASQNGIIYKDATRFLHNFNYGNNGTVTTDGFNTFLGLSSGNFTMGSTATVTYQASLNTAVGYNSFLSNTTGYYAAAFGARALQNNTTGYYNSAIGTDALYENTTGYRNTALGHEAGRYFGGGTSLNQNSNTSVYLGNNTRASASGNANEIVIGYNTVGNGSNSVTLGNTSVTKTVLQGSVGIGTTAPLAKLHAGDTVTDYSGMSFTNTGAVISSVGADQNQARSNVLTLMRDGVPGVRFAGAARFDMSKWASDGTNARTQLDIRLANTDTNTLVDVLSLQSGGNVGIGTTSPSSKLDVTTNALGTTQTASSGLALVNTTAAAAGAQQISPALRWSGQGWKTDATAASQAVDFRAYVTPVQGTSAPTGYLGFESSINGGAYSATPSFVITSAGNIGIGTASPAQKLDITGGSLRLDNTSFASQTGIIYKDATRFLHNFNYGNNGTVTTEGFNTFLGQNAGNFTMGSTATAAFQASYNTGIGHDTLKSNTTGANNAALGNGALQASTNGDSNTAIGFAALYNNTGGDNNTALGGNAGRYIAGGSSPNQTSNTSLYLGNDTKSSANGNANEIVIGYNATGNGSNSVTLGNTSVTKTVLQGSVGIGETAPGAKLQVTTGAAGTIGQIIKAAASQTADLLQAQDSTGTVLSRIDAKGNIGQSNGNALYNATAGLGSGAARVDEATTNLAVNPSVEIDATNWSALFTANNTGARDTTTAFVGGASYKANRIAAYSDTRMARYSYNSHPAGTYAVSAWVKVQDAAIGTIYVAAEGCGATASSANIINTGGVIGQWVRVTSQYTVTVAGNMCFNFYGGTNQVGSIFIDAFQLENKAYATSYADGSLGTGFAWTGTAHASTSTRIAGRFVGDAGTFLQGLGTGGHLSVSNGATINTGIAANVGLTVKAAASQTADLLQAQDSTGAILAKITSVGNLEVKNATITGTLTVNGHVITANTSGSTTVAANTAVCGTGCTVTISGNDTSGVITVNTGTGVTAGTLGTVTFANAYGAAPRVVLTPETVPGSSTFPQYHYGSSTTTFDLKAYNALTASVTYKFSYQIVQ